MIYLGLQGSEKSVIVEEYCKNNKVNKVFVISPIKFEWFNTNVSDIEVIKYTDTIMYATFYRLLQEVDRSALVVLNECLRTQNRNDLTYNCIRHFLNQAGHQLVFQYLPIIAGLKDIFILLDFDTKSKWKKEKDTSLLKETVISVRHTGLKINPIEFQSSDRLKDRYAKTKEKLFAEIALRDPHTIPRNLVLLSGKEKAKHIDHDSWYVGRNKRLKLDRHQTYRDKEFVNRPYTIFEPCHRFIDMADFMYLSEQNEFDYLLTDLNVEQWYLHKYQEWSREIEKVYSVIQQNQCA